MKKFVSTLLVCVLFALSIPFSASAYKIGDVVGYALSTDIAATINGYDIPSFNVDGYTYVTVEDLRYYGFSVNYDDSTRSLSVSRDWSQEYVSKVYEKPYVLSGNVGKRERRILYTDIVTYLDGNYVPAYNIDGQTIISFDSLSAYGGVSYDNNKREISLSLTGLGTNPNPVMRASEFLQKIQGHWAKGWDFISFEGNEYVYATYCSEVWHMGTIVDIQRNSNNSVTLKIDCPAMEYGYELVYEAHIATITFTSTDGFTESITRDSDSYYETETFDYVARTFDEFASVMDKKFGF